MERKTLFNDGWSCAVLDHEDKALLLSSAQKASYEEVRVPHDALIKDTKNLYRDCVIWYRKTLGFTPKKDRRYLIYFEGVYMDSTVYVNDEKIGDWAYGYTSFFFEITDRISSPEDVIRVRINHRSPNTRWYGGPGINRNVFLYEVPKSFLTPDGLYIHTEKERDTWNLYVSNTLSTVGTEKDGKFEMSAELSDVKGKSVYRSGKLPAGTILIEGLHNIREWDITDPYLYSVKVCLYLNGKLCDSTESRFGFRMTKYTSDRGFFLNDRHVKLNGMCLHTDGGCIGMAFHRDLALRQILLMKKMGANAIRFAHNPPAPEFLDLCDEYGMLVLDEAYDCWKNPKTEFDYARFFEDWYEKDMRSFVRRDRNHPSVIMWSIGNEIYDTHKDAEEGIKTMEALIRVVKEEDPYENARATLCSNYIPWENTQKAADVIKLIGYNYAERLYEEHHKAHPDWIIFGSETGSIVQSRNVYHFPVSRTLLADEDGQCSSLGNSVTSWGARNHDFCITTERDTPFSLGQFLWTGIDYLGEPTPYHTKNSYFGLADTACFPKDAYYLYQSEWTDAKDNPVIHIMPYWDFNEGELIDVRVCSNADTVELFLNDESLGKKRIDHKHGKSLYADYSVSYEKGVLKAVGYDIDENVLCETKQCSFGEVTDLRISQSSFTVKEGEDRLFFAEISGIDSKGNEVKNGSRRVKVKVTGPGYVAGLDNGDSTDYDLFQADTRRMFNGKLLAVIRSSGKAGKIRVEASLDEEDITVRKVYLSVEEDEDTILTPEHNDIRVFAKVSPQEAKDFTIEYQITNETGVPITNAKVIKEDETGVIIRAGSDCEMKLRALSKDKDGKVVSISSLSFTASGFGTHIFDPYEFISASLCTKADETLGNGNENGVCTQDNTDSWFAFENVDFGSGADTVSLPVFELQNIPFEVIFWDGIPLSEEGRIIGRGIYDLPSMWNTYQAKSFTLSERMKGIRTFGIEIKDHKAHIRGFQFERKSFAFELNIASDADEIYGDTYTLTEDAVNGIGNNVSLKYGNMDFGSEGAGSVTIEGHTDMENNTIHILFEGEEGSKREIIEFAGSEKTVERKFEINRVKGNTDVTFLFLPGCDFDFRSFRFGAD